MERKRVGDGKQGKKRVRKIKVSEGRPALAGVKFTDWAIKVGQGPALQHTPHTGYLLSYGLTHSVLPEPLLSSNLLLHKTNLPDSLGLGNPRKECFASLVPPSLSQAGPAIPRSQFPPYPPRTALLSVSCLYGNSGGPALGEEASGKCSFL